MDSNIDTDGLFEILPHAKRNGEDGFLKPRGKGVPSTAFAKDGRDGKVRILGRQMIVDPETFEVTYIEPEIKISASPKLSLSQRLMNETLGIY